MDPEKEKLMGDDATTGNTKREPAKPMLKLLEYLPNPVTGPALGTIVESEAHRNHLVLLPWVSSMWFVLGLFLLVGQCEYLHRSEGPVLSSPSGKARARELDRRSLHFVSSL